MKIYIMRHGEAGYSALSDADRSLTALGEKQCRAVADWFNGQQITFDLGLVSPYLRAQQSFAVIAERMPTFRMQTNKLLTPGGSTHSIAEYLMTLPQAEIHAILIVSHLPLVGYLVNQLCPSVSPPMFSTADVACISLSFDSEDAKGGNIRREGVLEWFHHPI